MSDPSSNSSPEMYTPAASQTASTISPPGTADSRGPTQTVPAACLACRGKHLKCDGSTPCSRCLTSSSECVYVASRRGYKGPRKNSTANPNKRHASDSPPLPGGESCPMLLGAGTPMPPTIATFNPGRGVADGPISPFGTTPLTNTLQLYRTPYLNHTNGAMVSRNNNQVPARTISEQCIDAFYFYFYPGHPVVLPKTHLTDLAKTRNLEHLLAAMKWVGSLYIEIGPARATYFEETMRLLYAPETPKDGFLVQAMMIAIVGLDGCRQNEKARDILSDAERLAIEFTLYNRDYATKHGGGNPRLEESWRRTWWDLLVVDGMIAGVHRQTNFLLYDFTAGPELAGLPCEEHEYTSGKIPRPMYLEDFEDQLFSGEDRMFSSFAYRVASIRNLGNMMRLSATTFSPEETVDKVETLLSNWRLHLPEAKRHCLNRDGQLDEMMFQAFMINHACTIILHQPHSQLDTSATRDVTACAPHRDVASGQSFNLHTRHILTAAQSISRMVTYEGVPITGHTHFFTCVLTLSSIVHLSKWAAVYYLGGEDEEDLRQQVRLNIGALNKLSAVWRAAAAAGAQVRAVAQDIYRDRRARQANPRFWEGYTHEEIMSSMTADDGIMSEISLLPAAPDAVMPPPQPPS
ncbi:putative C6 zinc finger domain-containing protein [Rosellinia necatrix]|uniref:Putative C6 zinc finger domain-containing protein n=1 Tax=Rosellinia necatrix TaxID=77044 RepID=A0A1W2TMY8_ROSNE|nr:putative C6 zinc finger domain-containing protein [Rosellinia necatrix]